MYYLSKSLILIRKINIQGGETGVLQGGRKYTLSYLEMNRRCHHVGKSTHTGREKSQAIVFSSKLGLKNFRVPILQTTKKHLCLS